MGGRVTSTHPFRPPELNKFYAPPDITCDTHAVKRTINRNKYPMSSSTDPLIPTDNTEISAEPSPPPPSDSPDTTGPESATAVAATDTQGTTKLSKNARKRQLKAKRWEETREAWKTAKREKKKARKAAERAKAKAVAEKAREGEGNWGRRGVVRVVMEIKTISP